MTLKRLSREELIALVKIVQKHDVDEEDIHTLVSIIRKYNPDPEISDYIYWDDLTPEEIVDKALAYEVIQLSPPKSIKK